MRSGFHPNFPLYLVYEDGTVISYVRRLPRKMKWKKMIYPGLRLQTAEGRGHLKNVHIHTLVATVFHGPRPEGLECRHLDGDYWNPHESNLCWGTRSENVRDAFRHGTKRGKLNPTRGTRNGQTGKPPSITGVQLAEMRRRRAAGQPYQAIADELGLSRTGVRKAILGVSVWAKKSEAA